MGSRSLWRAAGYDSLEDYVVEAFFAILEPQNDLLNFSSAGQNMAQKPQQNWH